MQPSEEADEKRPTIQWHRARGGVCPRRPWRSHYARGRETSVRRPHRLCHLQHPELTSAARRAA